MSSQTIGHMINHYRAAYAAILKVHDLADRLEREYVNGSHNAQRVAALHQQLGRELKLAGIHAQLAQVDAVNDLARDLDARAGAR